jgi:diaminopimelate decarboxylase
MNQDLELWNLKRHGQDLLWDGCSLMELARTYGTPAYVVNASLLKQCHKGILESFRREGLNAKLFFSYKTNPIPGILKVISALECGAEIISDFEFWLAESLGLGGPDIVVNGPVKTPSLLQHAVRSGVALINVECLEELRRVQSVVSELAHPVRIGLRINPCLRSRHFDFTLSSGTRANPVGFRPGGPEWGTALQILREEPMLQFQGIHFHIGSGIPHAEPYMAALQTALGMWTDMLERGFHPTVLDMGGGFGTATLRGLNLAEAIQLFGWSRPPKLRRRGRQDNLLNRIACGYSKALNEYAHQYGIGLPTIYLESGRALSGPSQLLLPR